MTSVAPPSSTADAHKYGVLFVFAAGVLWSTVGLGIRLIEDAVVWQILLYRSISMSLFLYVVIRVRSGESPFVQIRRIGFPSVIAGLSLVAAYSGGIYSIQNTSVANAMLLFATAPFMAAVLGWIILRERVRVATWVAIAVAIGGIAIMVADKSGSVALKGSLAALGSAFGFAVFTVALRWGRTGEMLPSVFLSGLFAIVITFGICHIPGAIHCSQLARRECRHGHGGLSGGCGADPIHAGITQSACCRACLAVLGRGPAWPALGLALPWRNSEPQYASRRRSPTCGDCRKCAVRQATKTPGNHCAVRMFAVDGP